MLALGIVLSIVGLGFFCWLLFTLAIYALPFFVGMTIGFYAHHTGSGPLGAFGLGLIAAVFVFLVGRVIFSIVRTPFLRIPVALMFAVPAGLAGYYTTFGLAALTMTSDLRRQVFAVTGAAVIGAMVWTRLAISSPEEPSGPGRSALL